MLSLEQIRQAVAPLAEQYGLDRVFLFGSYARGEATEESDVDLRIDRGSMHGLQFGGLYEDIKESLARPVDILTTEQMGAHLLSHIKKEEILLYDRAKQGHTAFTTHR